MPATARPPLAEEADLGLSSNNNDDGALQDVHLTLGSDQRAALHARYFLKCAMVRSQASLAADSSKRGVELLWKPCCVPGYLCISCGTPAAFSAVSKAGHMALMRSSFSA